MHWLIYPIAAHCNTGFSEPCDLYPTNQPGPGSFFPRSGLRIPARPGTHPCRPLYTVDSWLAESSSWVTSIKKFFNLAENIIEMIHLSDTSWTVDSVILINSGRRRKFCEQEPVDSLRHGVIWDESVHERIAVLSLLLFRKYAEPQRQLRFAGLAVDHSKPVQSLMSLTIHKNFTNCSLFWNKTNVTFIPFDKMGKFFRQLQFDTNQKLKRDQTCPSATYELN